MRHFLWILATLVACGNDDTDAPDPPDAATSYRAEVVAEDSFIRDGRTFPIQLVRVIRPDGGRTYIQWIKSDKPAPRPAVLSTDPYGGLDWTGEEVDLRWAGRAAGIYPDVDGPNYTGDHEVVYYPTSVQAAADQEFAHLINDFAVARVHARFYAGGSIADEIEDVKAGMWFLAEQPDVDRARIGVYGGSWGGFEALYASAFGDRRAAPVVTVALYPPVDFSSWAAAAAAMLEPGRSGVEGHLRRIYATTGGPAAGGGTYDGLTTDALCAGLPAATLVLHDDIDNLVRIEQSERLVATCGGDAIYWRRAAGPDPSAATHGALLDEPVFPSVSTYSLAYLHRRLAAPDAPDALVAHLTTVRDAQVRGEDVAFAAPRLRELCDSHMSLFNLATLTIGPGAAAVATAVNTVWGTTHNAASIDSALATGLPPP